MTKMRIANLIMAVMAVFLTTSCKSCKDKEPEKVYIKNEENAKAVTFLEGSYFIMRNTVTGDIDSYHLQRYIREVQPESFTGYVYEYISSTFDNNKDDIMLHKNITMSYTAANESELEITTSSSYKNYVLLKIPFVENTSYSRNSNQTVICMNYYPNYDLNGYTYNYVYRLRTLEQNGDMLETYFSTSSGLIKYTTVLSNDTNEYDLLRTNIEK